MNESVRRHAPQAVAGCGLTVFAVVCVLSGEIEGTIAHVTRTLFPIGGVGMLLGSAYEAMTADTDRTERTDRDSFSSTISLLSGVLLLAKAVLIAAF